MFVYSNQQTGDRINKRGQQIFLNVLVHESSQSTSKNVNVMMTWKSKNNFQQIQNTHCSLRRSYAIVFLCCKNSVAPLIIISRPDTEMSLKTKRRLTNHDESIFTRYSTTACESHQKKSGITSVWKDLVAGGIAGKCGIIVGHPLDTVKVRLQQQIQQPKTNIMTVTPSSSIIRGDNNVTTIRRYPLNFYRSLYRGVGAPLATAAVVNASVFCVYGSLSRMWDNHYNYPSNSSVAAATTTMAIITKHSICGLITGLVTSILLCPIEHVKIQLQTKQHQVSTISRSYSNLSSYEVVKQIICNEHGLKGIYRGFFATCLRQGPSFAIYFPVYHILKETIGRNNGDDNNTSSINKQSSVSLWCSSALAGGLAGSLSWIIVYPVDVIKSRIQSLPIDTISAKKKSFYSIARNIYQNEGGIIPLIFSRGLAVTILRAFPVNGTIFFVYEFVNQWLMNNENNIENCKRTIIVEGHSFSTKRESTTENHHSLYLGHRSWC